MIIIQIILVTGFIVFLYRILTNPRSYQLKAWTKIFAILFAVTAIFAILLPETTNHLAHWVGVKRGADLLLYLLTIAFIFSILHTYLQEKRQQKEIVLLARKIAIIEANTRKTNQRNTPQ
jgi:small membrane protein